MEVINGAKDQRSIDAGHGYMRVVPAIVAALVLGFVVLIAALVLFVQRLAYWPRPDGPLPIHGLPSFGGEPMLIPFLLGAILLVLVGVFVLLMVVGFCMCGCKGVGIPLPGLPDVKKLATILRGIATALKDGAAKIDTANTIVNDARGKLPTVTSFKVTKPKLKKIPLPGGGEGWVPDGTEEVSPFDDDVIQKLTTFANDATGKSALDAASGMLRDKAAILEEQANTLDSQP